MSRSLWRCANQIGWTRKLCFQYETRALFSNTTTRCIEPGLNDSISKRLDSMLTRTSDSINQAVRSRSLSDVDKFVQAGKSMESLLAEPHHLHIFSQRHNTHLTLTRPNGEPLISLSTGNVGFKKHQRGTYEAAFQLTSYVLRSISEKGFLQAQNQDCINRLELVFRGFGDGRQAFQTALLGVEGRFLRSTIIRVSDATRIKIGGNKGKKPRRLG